MISCGRSCPQEQKGEAQELTIGFGNMKVLGEMVVLEWDMW